MPSRKKAQGKARKAAQEEEKRKKEVFKAAQHMIDNSPEVQLHYSMITDIWIMLLLLISLLLWPKK